MGSPIFREWGGTATCRLFVRTLRHEPTPLDPLRRLQRDTTSQKPPHPGNRCAHPRKGPAPFPALNGPARLELVLEWARVKTWPSGCRRRLYQPSTPLPPRRSYRGAACHVLQAIAPDQLRLLANSTPDDRRLIELAARGLCPAAAHAECENSRNSAGQSPASPSAAVGYQRIPRARSFRFSAASRPLFSRADCCTDCGLCAVMHAQRLAPAERSAASSDRCRRPMRIG